MGEPPACEGEGCALREPGAPPLALAQGEAERGGELVGEPEALRVGVPGEGDSAPSHAVPARTPAP